jgi:hypothetical protein
MAELEKKGSGIILMHDVQMHTAIALPKVLDELKSHGYRVVHVCAIIPEIPCLFPCYQGIRGEDRLSMDRVVRQRVMSNFDAEYPIGHYRVDQ